MTVYIDTIDRDKKRVIVNVDHICLIEFIEDDSNTLMAAITMTSMDRVVVPAEAANVLVMALSPIPIKPNLSR